MRLLPRSLFGRLALLLLAVVAVALAATILLFRQDRLSLLARQFSDTKIVQLQAVRAALEANDTPERRESIGRIGREYGVRIVPESERPFLNRAPVPPLLEPLEARLREALGAGHRIARRARSRRSFSSASRRRARVTGSAFRCRRASSRRITLRAPRCGA